MKKIFIAILIISLLFPVFGGVKNTQAEINRSGYILLQVEDNGEAWYVYPKTQKRYYMGRPLDAFNLMRRVALGAKHDFIDSTKIFPNRLSGQILLDVEMNGEAYYIYPNDQRKYYLGRPADAFRIMRELGQGISNTGLSQIPIGDIDNIEADIPATGKVLLDAPFAPQAPFGNWNDQRQQDGCEESSALMAVKWAHGESLTYTEALDEIISISDFELEKYGEYRDISTLDTVNWIFKDYLNYDKVELKTNISIQDIINELRAGNLVVVPADGQVLNNPYFTPPGPPRHMLVIKGYDPVNQTFITNDPGTRHGESFEYDTEILYDAIRDYPTGYHEPIEKIEKMMIVVRK